jgi:alpha-tubulin suppressor-like RCC1 family protein
MSGNILAISRIGGTDDFLHSAAWLIAAACPLTQGGPMKRRINLGRLRPVALPGAASQQASAGSAGGRRARWRRSAQIIVTAAVTGIAALALGTMAGAGGASASPAALSAPAVSTVATGYGHTCAIRADDTLWCWGSNYSGELGDGTTTARTSPVRVGDVATWASIDAGTSYNCAVRADGTLWCWGNNFRGQLGDGTTTSRTAPVRVGDSTAWASVSAGDSHTCATRTDGTLWCWGFNRFAQLGVGTDPYIATTPVRVGTAADWAAVTTGYAHTCAVRTSGTLWCWGNNTDGQLGVGDLSYRATPAQVGTATTWSGVSAGYAYACAVRTEGTVWCWGENGYGQLGVSGTHQTAPVRVGDGTSWSGVRASFDTACALRTDSSLWCWGNNSTGQLDDGTTTHRNAPTRIGVAATTWTNDYAVGYHICAYRTDGSLRCWGNNANGQLGDATTTRKG